MAKGKVIKVEYVDSYTGQQGTLYNFAVLVEGEKRAFFISVKDKEKPMVSVGDELDYEIVAYDKTPDKMQHKFATINGNNVDLIKIKKNQPMGGGGFGGGGGKSYAKTPEQVKNELASFVGGYAQQVLCHRINLGKDAEDIVKQYEILVDGFYKALVKHIK